MGRYIVGRDEEDEEKTREGREADKRGKTRRDKEMLKGGSRKGEGEG